MLGVTQAARGTAVPIAGGILTCDVLAPALKRARGKAGNKGVVAALTAIDVVNLPRQLLER
jgi:6,7-dimethyl-8-ribityllumazine synthase